MQVVAGVTVAPIHTCVAEHRVLLTHERAHLVLTHTSHSGHVIAGHTVEGNVIHLVGIDEVIAEML